MLKHVVQHHMLNNNCSFPLGSPSTHYPLQFTLISSVSFTLPIHCQFAFLYNSYYTLLHLKCITAKDYCIAQRTLLNITYQPNGKRI